MASAGGSDSQELVRHSMSVLTEAGKLTVSTVETTGFPKEFKALDFKTPVRYIGHLADMDLTRSSLAGVWPSVGEIVSSMNFHFHDNRIMASKAQDILNSLIEIRTTSGDDVRGKFQRTGDDTIVIAFLHKWASLIEKGRTNDSSQLQTMVERMSAASRHIRYRLVPALGADPKAVFFNVFQAGEDAVKKAEDVGNHITFRRGERFLALQSILKSAGEPHSNEAMCNVFKEQEANGLLTYARKDSRVDGPQVIQKILALLSRSRDAGVYDLLKSLQFTADGQATCIASWTVAVKFTTFHKSDEEFAWVSNVLFQAMRSKGWPMLAQDLGGEAKAFRSSSAKEGTPFQIVGWTFQVLRTLVQDLRLAATEPSAEKINEILDTFLDWKKYSATLVHVHDQTHIAHLGTHVIKAVSLLSSVANGDHYALFKSIVTNVEGAAKRMQDPRLKALLAPMLAEWKAVAEANTVRLQAKNAGGEESEAVTELEYQGEAPSSIKASSPEEIREKALEKVAQAEIRTYVHFCSDVKDTAAMKELLTGSPNPALKDTMPGITAAQIDFQNKAGFVFELSDDLDQVSWTLHYHTC